MKFSVPRVGQGTSYSSLLSPVELLAPDLDAWGLSSVPSQST